MNNLKNLDIRKEIKSANLKLWEIAEQLGITDFTFSRRLRKELSEIEKNEIRQIIQNLIKKNA